MQGVDTRSGRIEGIRGEGVTAFLGIPYARAPRFRAPTEAEPWTGLRRTGSCGPSAPQRGGILARLGGQGEGAQSEECLNLNVWTPAADAGRRPVMVWIHGGSFTSGSGGSPLYAGAALARGGDVVVVTLSYRLGALGYLAHPALGHEPGAGGNRGLLDQIEALRWVREHIGSFGGDPGRVLLFGESAGAMSVGTLLATPAARGLFQAAVLQSGAAENASPREEALRVAKRFATEIGAGEHDVARILFEAPVERILDAQERTSAALWRELRGLAYQPLIDGDVLPAAPLATIRAGQGAQVPIVVGTNRDEYRLWAPTDLRARTLDPAGLVKRLSLHLPGTWPEQAADLYLERGLSACDAWFAIETDRLFRAPALELAEAQGTVAESFVYRFDWTSPALDGLLGACHGLEIPFVFGTCGMPGIEGFAGSGDDAALLSDRIRDAWCAFARHATPGAGSLAGWERYVPETRITQLLGAQCETVAAPDEALRAFWVEARADPR